MSPKATQPAQPQPPEPTERGSGSSTRRMLSRRVARVPLGAWLGLVAVLAVLGAAYGVGGEPGGGTHAPTTAPVFDRFAREAIGAPVPAASAGAVSAPQSDLGESAFSKGGAIKAAPNIGPQIVKTGSMAIEVASIDRALAQAEAAIVGLGGSVSSNNQSGSGDNASASVTYRIPVARWNDALKAIRDLGKLVNQQTGSNDVTGQVVDLDARLDNLKVTETALQGIMAKASAIPDILAVEQQLSNVQGQIEQLTAQRNYLADQAAMSTLSVAFVLPSQTVTTQATNGWTLSGQIDEAGAALVRIGQGLATLAVWAVIVGLPVAIGLLILWILYRIVRRVRRRPSDELSAA